MAVYNDFSFDTSVHEGYYPPIMSTYKLSKTINIEQMCQQASSLTGQFNLVECQRLAPLLLSTEAMVDFSLHFMQDDASRKIVRLTIDCGLMLECQRCLQPMCYQVAIDNLLLIVTSAEEADNCPDGYEPLMLTSNEIALGDLLEEELLLQLPIVAKHSEAECSVNIPSESSEPSKKPFAALNTLMRSDKNGSTEKS